MPCASAVHTAASQPVIAAVVAVPWIAVCEHLDALPGLAYFPVTS